MISAEAAQGWSLGRGLPLVELDPHLEVVGVPEDLTFDVGPKSWQFHAGLHRRYLGQTHGVRDTLEEDEDPERLTSDDLSGDPSPDRQGCDGCRPAPQNHIRRRRLWVLRATRTHPWTDHDHVERCDHCPLRADVVGNAGAQVTLAFEQASSASHHDW